VDGPPGARPQVEALPLVWALGSHAAGWRAEIAGPAQPNPCKGDIWAPGQTLDDPLQHKIDRPRFGNGERYRLQHLRLHEALILQIASPHNEILGRATDSRGSAATNAW